MRRWKAAIALTVIALATILLGAQSIVRSAPLTLCPQGTTLNFVAHEDDDLLFLSPDVLHDIHAGKCVATVFLTAGDAGDTSAYWLGRENGSKAAYAQMAGFANSWTQSTLTVTTHPLALFTLDSSTSNYLVFMRLPDGGSSGSGFSRYNRQSLQKLWQGSITSITADDASTSYTKPDLVATLAGLMQIYQPDTVHTQNYIGTYGNGDHSDHLSTAYLTYAAHQQYATTHTITGYDGYPMSSQPANVFGADADQKQTAFLTYAQYDPRVCQTASQCAGTNYGAWLQRQYITASEGLSTPTPTPATTAVPTPTGGNIAPLGTGTASSPSLSTGQYPTKAVDGFTDGYPAGDPTHEWATTSQGAGAWLNLAWPAAHTVYQVTLFDRPNLNDQITAGTLSFSDGTSLPTGTLNNDGSPVTLTFPAKTVTGLRLDITGVSNTTLNTGLAEIQVYESAQAVTPTPTATAGTPEPTLTPTETPTPGPTLTPTPTPTPDVVPPSVAITSPLNGATVARGRVTTIQASASDNAGVVRVEFYVNGALKCTATAAPYSCAWNVPAKPGVTYTLVARAYDAANNSATSTISVTAR